MSATQTLPHTLLRALIRDNASTARGFQLLDAKDLEANHYASRAACRQVLAGVLFRCKVKGHHISYHATQEKADKMKALQVPRKRFPKPVKIKAAKPVKPVKVKVIKPPKRDPVGLMLRALIAAKSATPEGFRATDLPAEKVKAGYSHSSKMRAEGLIFASKQGKDIRYFDTAAKAKAWGAAQQALRPVVVRVERAPPKPREAAVIVYPPGYKHTVYQTPAPRFTSFQMPLTRTGMRAMSDTYMRSA